MFRSASGIYVRVDQLEEGSRVLSAAGDPLMVMKVRLHKGARDRPVRLVELVTDSASHVFTELHRVVTPAAVELAGLLQPGSEVRVTGGVEVLRDVRSREAEVDCYEVTFHPDKPVATFLEPTGNILSMGQQARPSQTGGLASASHSQRHHRRGGMNKRIERARQQTADSASVTGTIDPYA